MGTSTSHGGPGDGPGLLPNWALPENESPPENGGADEATIPIAPPVEASEAPRLWQNAKSQMTRWVKGSSSNRNLRSAGNAYVRSRGGARAASFAARSGRSVSSNLGSFLSGVASRGINPTLVELGLSSVVGQNAETVLAAISNRLAPAGNTKEEVAARRAMNEVLSNLYAKYISDGNIAELERLDGEAIASVVGDSVAAYIYFRWLDDLGLSIEKGAISEAKAVELERQIREYVRHSVALAFEQRNLVDMDWASPASRTVITGIYRDAYAILEASQ